MMLSVSRHLVNRNVLLSTLVLLMQACGGGEGGADGESGPTTTNSPLPNLSSDSGSQPQSSVPAAPSSLTIASQTSAAITLAWTDNSSNESAFIVQRRDDANPQAGFVAIADVAANSSSYIDESVSPSTSYTYRVAARTSTDTSAFSNEVSGQTASSPGSTVSWAKTYSGSASAVRTTAAGEYVVAGSIGQDMWIMQLASM